MDILQAPIKNRVLMYITTISYKQMTSSLSEKKECRTNVSVTTGKCLRFPQIATAY